MIGDNEHLSTIGVVVKLLQCTRDRQPILFYLRIAALGSNIGRMANAIGLPP